MEYIDNKSTRLGDGLRKTIKKSSKLRVCASIFSMYGFDALRAELLKIDSLKFIFTDPTFIKHENDKKETRQFEVNSGNREKSVNGSEFEVRLKNELNTQIIAKECANWVKNKAKFRSNLTNGGIMPFISVDTESELSTYLGIDEFSAAGFGYEKDNAIYKPATKFDEYENSKQFIDNFESIWNDDTKTLDVTDEVVNFLSDLYKENSPEFIYYVTLYNIFTEFLEDISEDELANDRTGFKNSKIWNTLYDFQRDAALGIINKLERYNGCILADSVGLGKTFTALAVMKYYQERNRTVLVLCPKKLSDNWNTYRENYKDNILAVDRFNYDVLYHTDLSRNRGQSNGKDLAKINWGNYDLVVIDESHNFRNNNSTAMDDEKESRYERLMRQIIKEGVKTKVLMLSATPVNNKFLDLRNQIALAYEGQTSQVDARISNRSIDDILKNAQTIFNEWSKLPVEERTSAVLLEKLSADFDFFKLLDSVTIARSRKHIERYYNMDEIGRFPTRLKPISKSPELTDLDGFMSIKEISNELMRLKLCVYTPSEYILPNRQSFYEDMYDFDTGHSTFKQVDRESNLKILMHINLLKRLESSVESFRLTLSHILKLINDYLLAIENFDDSNIANIDFSAMGYSEDDDIEEIMDDALKIGEKVQIKLRDMNTEGWKRDLEYDAKILNSLLSEMQRVTPEHDLKLRTLKELIGEKVNNPINPGNKKVIIFSAFADTANYLYENLALPMKQQYGMDSCEITGTGVNQCTLPIDKEFNNLLINFSPISKHRVEIDPDAKEELELLVATDCISEGQNLQDCDYLVNYDIHWNPVRIIQRFGRIDRIGSKNTVIQLVNFWPNISLDDYINLKNRVENRMAIVDMTATGEDNVLTNESNDMEYRKAQLKRLQEEVVDIEDMDSGVSITDLGLNDFRMDLVEYAKDHVQELKKVPSGMHSVVSGDSEKGLEPGVIFILRNINSGININNMNQLHPFYLVYIKENGEIVSNHLNVKNTLDLLRLMSKGKEQPETAAYTKFNAATNDGKNMSVYSELLTQSIESIVNIKEESDLDSLFRTGGTSTLENDIRGLDDFELISFMVVV